MNKLSWPVDNDIEDQWSSTGGAFSISATKEQGIQFRWTGYNGKHYESDYIPWETGDVEINLKDHLTHYASDTETMNELSGIDAQIAYHADDTTNLDELVSYYDGSQIGCYTSPTKDSAYNLPFSNGGVYGSISLYLNYSTILKSGVSLSSGSGFSIDITQVPQYDETSEQGKGDWDIHANIPNIGSIHLESVYGQYELMEDDYNPASRDSMDQKTAWDLAISQGWQPIATKEPSYDDKYPKTKQDGWWGAYYKLSLQGDGTILIGDEYRNHHSYPMNNLNGASIHDALSVGSGNRTGGLLGDMDGDGADSGQIYGSLTIVSDQPLTVGEGDGKRSYQIIGSLDFNITNIKESHTEKDVFEAIQDALGKTAPYVFTSVMSTTYFESKVLFNHPGLVPEKYTVMKPLSEMHIGIHSADAASMTNKISLDYPYLDVQTMGLEDMNVLTVDTACDAMNAIDAAAKMVTTERSIFGAYQNRLEHTYSIDKNTSENTTAAESRIRDTDIPKEMVRYSKSSILEQAGQSMLAQANQSANGIQSLLQ